MKLALALCLISISLCAQKKKEGPDKKQLTDSLYSPYNFNKDKPRLSDSLDMELSWDEIFRSAGWDCNCPPSPEQVQQMPRELSPYQWKDKGKPIVITIDDSTYQQWIKNEKLFKQNYRRADSLMRLKNNSTKKLQ